MNKNKHLENDASKKRQKEESEKTMELGFGSVINQLEFLYKLHEQNNCLADCIYLTQDEYNRLVEELEDIKLYRKWEHNDFLYNLVTVQRKYHFLNLVVSED